MGQACPPRWSPSPLSGLPDAKVVLGPKADNQDKLHELGHLDQALRDPEGFIRDSEEAEKATSEKEYKESRSEVYADTFADDTKRNQPEPP